MPDAISVRNLRKRYGDVMALDDVTLTISRGEVFGFLGPNGAGKTTLVEILEGLRTPDAGEVVVYGFDPQTQSRALKEIMGVQLQTTAFYKKLKVREALEEFARFYQRQANIPSLLETFGLWEKREAFIETLSEGQKQRLAVALALVNDPSLFFLDEPTAGLDPQTRREIWEIVREKKREGRTIVFTTHYIDEAERLCDRVAILDAGKVLALDSPGNLIAKSSEYAHVRLMTEEPLAFAPSQESPYIRNLVAVGDREYLLQIKATEIGGVIAELLRALEQEGNRFADLSISRPTLEDVFVELTGRRIRE